jgi:hypothetical protein
LLHLSFTYTGKSVTQDERKRDLITRFKEKEKQVRDKEMEGNISKTILALKIVLISMFSKD